MKNDPWASSSAVKAHGPRPVGFEHLVLPLATLLLLFFFGVLPPAAARIGDRQRAVMLVCGVILPLLLVLSKGGLDRCAERIETLGPWIQRHPRALVAGLFFSALALYTIVGWSASHGQAVAHDEFSYLFGAQTFALGRWYNPPHPLAEFFDAMHVLHEDKWVTRYPPGHCLALLPGVWVGWPSLGPVVFCAATVVGITLLARDLLGSAGAVLAGLLALQAPAMIFIASGWFAQSSFWFMLSGFYVCSFRAADRKHRGWGLAAGSFAGTMLLTRPFPAVAMGWPAAAWLLRRCATKKCLPSCGPATAHPPAPRSWVVILSALAPFLMGAGLFCAYNALITGRAFYTPWQQYRDLYEPANSLGFSRGSQEPRPDAAHVHGRKLQKAEAMRQDKLRFTPAEALRRALLLRIENGRLTLDPKRPLDTLFPATGFIGLAALWPFAMLGRKWRGPHGVLFLAVLSHYLAYSLFHAARDVGYYALEVAPLLAYFTAAGAVGFWRSCRSHGRASLALASVALVAAALLNLILVQGPQFVRQRRDETACERQFQEKLARRPDAHQPALVFVRYAKEHPFDRCDWIHNNPLLDAAVIVALDWGARNQQLMASFPQRRAFLYDEATDELIPLAP